MLSCEQFRSEHWGQWGLWGCRCSMLLCYRSSSEPINCNVKKKDTETVRNYGTVIYHTSTVWKKLSGTVRNYGTVKIFGTNYGKTYCTVPYYMPWQQHDRLEHLKDSFHSLQQVPGAPPPYTSVLKPKPILVDKQASEPNTPTNKYFERPMTRGNSDVSQRMKKRVTLRYCHLAFFYL